MARLGISPILNLINNTGTNITNSLDARYTTSEVDNVTSNIDLNIFTPKQNPNKLV